MVVELHCVGLLYMCSLHQCRQFIGNRSVSGFLEDQCRKRNLSVSKGTI